MYYTFGPFCLDAKERLLLRDGRVVPLAPKALSTLLVLVLSNGHVVGKDVLMNEVWPEEFVEEGNLAQHIFMLRRALGETIDSPRYIETVPRRGYRFLGAVRQHSDGSSSTQSQPPRRQPDAEASRPPHLLAVLPFVNDRDPKTEYLADGITESIINSLSQLPRLRVMSRSAVFRYKGKTLDARLAGTELGVEAVLVGEVNVKDGGLLIRAEMVDVANGWQLWGANYDRVAADIFDVQSEIAKQITTTLRLRLSGDEKQMLTKRYTESTEAYNAYLKGRYFWNKCTRQGLEKSVDCFQRAVQLDPSYAVAYAGIAASYFRMATIYLPPQEAFPKSKAAAIKALELDDLLSEAHATLGMVKMRCDWDWDAARQEFERALEISPGYATAYQWYGNYLDSIGEFADALREKRRALKLDPVSPSINVSIGTTFWMMGQAGEALRSVYEALEMDKSFPPALLLLGVTSELTGNFSQSIANMERAREVEDAPIAQAYLGRAYAVAGMDDKAKVIIEELIAQSARRYVSAYGIALIHDGLKATDLTFDWLEKAYNDRDEFLCWLKVDPRFEHLRSDTRFKDLQRRIFSAQSMKASS
jgi:TolB-like protein